MNTEVNVLSHGQENDFPSIEWCIGNYPGLFTIVY